jgi:hypothetical protein
MVREYYLEELQMLRKTKEKRLQIVLPAEFY